MSEPVKVPLVHGNRLHELALVRNVLIERNFKSKDVPSEWDPEHSALSSHSKHINRITTKNG